MLQVKYGYTRQQAREEISKLWSETETKNEARSKGAIQLEYPHRKKQGKPKRPSKGQRKHNRKVKQEARKNSIPGRK
ncbi:MAG: hypothetical protein IPG80_18560 [Anaerolineales bacterium]|uniref:hypothetical protein n=1 Tax=Candidatus Villigracilis vicinus TaxID=3140679 RepID=UPI00313492C9|nr:hypothetical protein [Anaerolineales bacterium]